MFIRMVKFSCSSERIINAGAILYPDGNEVEIIDIVYICEDFHGNEEAQASEVSDLKWFDICSIPDNLSPPIKSTLLKFIREKKTEADIRA